MPASSQCSQIPVLLRFWLSILLVFAKSLILHHSYLRKKCIIQNHLDFLLCSGFAPHLPSELWFSFSSSAHSAISHLLKIVILAASAVFSSHFFRKVTCLLLKQWNYDFLTVISLKIVPIITLNMELPYSSKSKMRARSGSGVRLDYFNRLVYKTILKYQVNSLFLSRV